MVKTKFFASMTPKKIVFLLLKTLGWVVLFFYALSLIYPFLWVIVNSLKSGGFFMLDSGWSIDPAGIALYNYIQAWTGEGIVMSGVEGGVGTFFLNSVWITSASVFLTVLLSAMAAYILAHFKFKMHGFVYGLAIATFLLPSVGTLAAFLQMMRAVRLDNALGLVIYYASGINSNMLILYGCFKGIPKDYAEAASIDGASKVSIFFMIMLPMAKAALVPVAVMAAINIWNDYFIPEMLLANSTVRTLAIGLNDVLAYAEQKSNMPLMFAAIIISCTPMIILYLILHRQILTNMMLGGLKG
ncbi:MAG: carbohydrate ABC transporter permease [Clostridia bacterium]|nr:carbohydrate ABC transporter permease [Clostridia bacterium]MBQ7913879.1 carbohydrate ABC transporter permease [Clostridia bacterium]